MTEARILIADDDTLLRSMAAQTLRHAGFDVAEVASGQAALDAFAADPRDLVLLDVMMDGLDGFETCARLRALPGGARVPVLMLTGLNDTASIETAYRAGATDFITKPIHWTLLAYRVRYSLRASAANEAVLRNQDSLARAQRLAHMGSWEMPADGATLVASDELLRIIGHTPGVPLTRALFLGCIAPEHRQRMQRARELALREGTAYEMTVTLEALDGRRRTVYEQAAARRDALGRVVALEGISQDVSERVEAERLARHLSLHDRLTGLATRDFFYELAAPALRRAQRQHTVCAVLSVDVDRFHSINDAHGHAGDDDVLRALATRLQPALRNQAGAGAEIVARSGSDTFLMLLSELPDSGAVAQHATQWLRALADPVHLPAAEVELSACIGVAMFPRDGHDSRELVRHAEQACNAAKAAGRGQLRFFDERLSRDASTRLLRESALRRAIAGGELRLHLQPKVDASTGSTVGAEALVRWQHPERGLVPPSDFVPLAEDSGLIDPLTDWVVDAALAMQARWRALGWPMLPLSVNVAAPSFVQDGFAERLQALAERHQAQPRQLTLEVTESLLLQDLQQAIGRMRTLRDSGFGLALDDFGTGYSSLGYLKQLPLDELKIDRSFVCDVANGTRDRAVVAAIMALARQFGMQVVAEGVETAAQSAMLVADGGSVQQGFLFARPMALADFEAWWQPQHGAAAAAAGPVQPH